MISLDTTTFVWLIIYAFGCGWMSPGSISPFKFHFTPTFVFLIFGILLYKCGYATYYWTGCALFVIRMFIGFGPPEPMFRMNYLFYDLLTATFFYPVWLCKAAHWFINKPNTDQTSETDNLEKKDNS